MKKTNQVGGYENKSTNIIIIYNIFSSLLLIISYILFGIASAIFINTCINFNKASIIDTEALLINQPIFEYLKPNNNLSIDKFLLYLDDLNNPFSWAINSIIYISIPIIAITIYYLSKDNSNFDIFKKDLFGTNEKKDLFGINEKKRSLVIKILIYILTIFIYQIAFKTIQQNFDSRLKDPSLGKIGTYNPKFEQTIGIQNGKYKNLFKKLKNIIIHWINNNEHENTTKINLDIEIIKQLEEPLVKDYNEIKDKFTIFEDILSIYYKDYDGKIIKNEEKIKFITFIDEYFNILINVKSTYTNYYARYYLLGLIKNNTPIDKNTSSRIYSLIQFKTTLRTELTAIKEEIKGYYKSIIAFYSIFLFIIFILYFQFIFNTVSDLLFMYKITYAGVITSIIIIICVYVIISMDGMSGTKNKTFYNNLLNIEDARYSEI